nr:SlyX family protein [Alicyclobacillus contaminans]
MLLVVIVILLVVLIGQRGRRWSNPRPDVRPGYYDAPTYQPEYDSFESRFGGAGTFLGGMAAGALLTWLLEQGRIDAAQYDYFNSLDDQRMLDELMQQNILQQQEIDALQRQVMDYGGYPGNAGPDFVPPTESNPFDTVDYRPDDFGYDDRNDNYDGYNGDNSSDWI